MIEQPAGWEEHLQTVVILVMCLEGVVGREVMCLVGKPWHSLTQSHQTWKDAEDSLQEHYVNLSGHPGAPFL